MSQDPLNDPALDALAGALRGLAPRPAGLDRDGLMFRAGRASAPRGWAWPLTAAASTVAAAFLGVLLWARPEPPPPVVYVAERPQPADDERAPAPDAEGRPGAWSHYLQLLETFLPDGLEGLPKPSEAPPFREGPQTVEALLQSL
jgi:hypothetical protein